MFDTVARPEPEITSPEARAAALAEQTGGPAAVAASGPSRGPRLAPQVATLASLDAVTVESLVNAGASEAEIAAHLDAQHRKGEAVEDPEAAQDRKRREIVARRQAADQREHLIRHFRAEIAGERLLKGLPALSADEERAAAIRAMEFHGTPVGQRAGLMAAQYGAQADASPPVAATVPKPLRYLPGGSFGSRPFYASREDEARAREHVLARAAAENVEPQDNGPWWSKFASLID